jgi:glycosyltransferase involved in cell wall biosynthesis
VKAGVVIPAYNEEARLGAVLEKTKQYVPVWAICVIDDGSDDRTSELAKSAGTECISFSENRGKGEALKAGFAWALKSGLDAVITLDGDGQHDPDRIPEFIRIMDMSHCDAVLGMRQFRLGEMPSDRILSNRISSCMVSFAARRYIQDAQCGYRMFRTSVLKDLKLTGSLYELESEILIRLSRKQAIFRVCPVPAVYQGVSSSIRRLRDIRRFLVMLIKLMFEK